METARPQRSGFTRLLHQGHFRPLATPILVGAAVLLVSALLLLSVNVSALRASFAWVQNADEIILEVSDLENAVLSHEMTVRGYALTGDPRFLKFQDNAQQAVSRSLQRLRTLLADEPSQVTNFRILSDVVSRHTHIFSALTSSGRGSSEIVADAIRNPANRALMREVRNRIDVVRRAEVAVLAERQGAASLRARDTYALAIGIVVAAFVLGGFGVAAWQFGPRSA